MGNPSVFLPFVLGLALGIYSSIVKKDVRAVGATPSRGKARRSMRTRELRGTVTTPISNEREFLRHTLATLAYRGGKVLRNAPLDLAGTRIEPTSRSALEILSHINDVFDWAVHLANGNHIWNEDESRSWGEEVTRFFDGLQRLDRRLALPEKLGFSEQRLFQGPVADALCHVGQIALLRRLAGTPVRGENYFKAEISGGRVGEDQADALREFD